MIRFHACPRCEGAVLENTRSYADDATCISCGWRRAGIPDDVRDQVQEHLGKRVLESSYVRDRVGTGKPPLSGWDRVKLQRERARMRLAEIAKSVRSG